MNVVDTYTWDEYKDQLKSYIQFPTCPDEDLKLQFESSVWLCYDYLNNGFVDSDGVDTTIPPFILRGIFEMVRKELNLNAVPGNLKKEKAANVELEYFRGELMTNEEIEVKYWQSRRLVPGF